MSPTRAQVLTATSTGNLPLLDSLYPLTTTLPPLGLSATDLLALACSSNQPAIASHLLSWLQLNTATSSPWTTTTGDDGSDDLETGPSLNLPASVFQAADYASSVEIYTLLLPHGLDLNRDWSMAGDTGGVVVQAVSGGDVDMLEWVLNLHTSSSSSSSSSSYSSSSSLSSSSSSSSYISTPKKIHPDSSPRHATLPALALAITLHKPLSLLSLLVSHGADVSSPGLLGCAVYVGNAAAVRFLLERGAGAWIGWRGMGRDSMLGYVRGLDGGGSGSGGGGGGADGCLHLAVERAVEMMNGGQDGQDVSGQADYLQVVRALLEVVELGDKGLRDGRGRTVGQVAVEGGWWDVLPVLEEFGAL